MYVKHGTLLLSPWSAADIDIYCMCAIKETIDCTYYGLIRHSPSPLSESILRQETIKELCSLCFPLFSLYILIILYFPS